MSQICKALNLSLKKYIRGKLSYVKLLLHNYLFSVQNHCKSFILNLITNNYYNIL